MATGAAPYGKKISPPMSSLGVPTRTGREPAAVIPMRNVGLPTDAGRMGWGDMPNESPG